MKEMLKGKTVLITGASSGLGREIALEASKNKASVILCARREDRLLKVKEECEKLSKEKAFIYKVDLKNSTDIDMFCSDVKENFKKIDILVNNAGFGIFNEVVDFNIKEVEDMFKVNTFAVMRLSSFFAKGMIERREGHIINIISQAGKMAFPEGSGYSASKFATYGFSNALRLELYKYNIFVTTVNPGPIETEFFDAANSVRDYVKKADSIMLSPEKLAKVIVKNMYKNKREINQPLLLEIGAKIYVLFPSFGDFLAKKIFKK